VLNTWVGLYVTVPVFLVDCAVNYTVRKKRRF